MTPEVHVRLVRRDGTVTVAGHRLRVARGADQEAAGTLGAEMREGIRTPIIAENRDSLVASCASSPELAAFAKSLPVAHIEDVDEGEEEVEEWML